MFGIDTVLPEKKWNIGPFTNTGIESRDSEGRPNF